MKHRHGKGQTIPRIFEISIKVMKNSFDVFQGQSPIFDQKKLISIQFTYFHHIFIKYNGASFKSSQFTTYIFNLIVPSQYHWILILNILINLCMSHFLGLVWCQKLVNKMNRYINILIWVDQGWVNFVSYIFLFICSQWIVSNHS